MPAHLPVRLPCKVCILSRFSGEGDPICPHFRDLLEPSLGDELGWIRIDLRAKLDCNRLDSNFRHWRDRDSTHGQSIGEVSFQGPLTRQIESRS